MNASMRRLLAGVAFGAAAAVCAPAWAGSEIPFTQAAFAAAEAAGKPIVVHVEASWCTTCAAQRPVLAALAADPKHPDLIVYKVDFDTQKDAVQAFGAQMQSTIIAFHGRTEEGRAVGITDPAAIATLVDKTAG